jgi:rsbT co-antagonist protein RsbR
MQPDFRRLATAWREQHDAFITDFTDTMFERAGPSYREMPREQVTEASRRLANGWQQALDSGNHTPLLEFATAIGQRRSSSHVGIEEIMGVVTLMREHMWKLLRQCYADGDWNVDVVQQVENWLHDMRGRIVRAYGQSLQEAWTTIGEREEALQAQGQLIQELSTPIVPIHEGVLVLPLVGAIDSRRATQIMESVLEQIVDYQAEVVILDITGVPVVDTSVANHLLQMARAVKLLGAQVVLVGIGAEIAQTIVQLGVDLNDITTRSNLQSGIEYALARQGYAVLTADGKPVQAAIRPMHAIVTE